MLQQTTVFASGTGGYHTYRIPALVLTTGGTLLAFCEGRKNSFLDSGDIDLLLRRSSDHGRTWGPARVVVPGAGNTAGNPAPVVDRTTGTVWLLFTGNGGHETEAMINDGQGARTVWSTFSADDGVTWSAPREITSQVKKPGWTWYATGPGHAIQLQDGRLLIPCNHVDQARADAQTPLAQFCHAHGHSHVIYSDDHGASWEIGGITQPGTNESLLVETADGRLYFNCRNYLPGKGRAVAWSCDQGVSFSPFTWDDALVGPCCQASAARFPAAGAGNAGLVLFANPASMARKRLVIRASADECLTWNQGQVLNAGRSAYSDLSLAADGNMACLYECGVNSAYEALVCARFDLDWLARG